MFAMLLRRLVKSFFDFPLLLNDLKLNFQNFFDLFLFDESALQVLRLEGLIPGLANSCFFLLEIIFELSDLILLLIALKIEKF